MLMIAVVSFTILALAAFCLTDKRLHLFEILAVWFTVTAVNVPIYSFFLVNRHWISVPDSKEKALIRIVYAVILIPLFLTWATDKMQALRGFGLKMASYLAIFVLILAGGWTLHKWGVVQVTPTGMWLYVPFKSLILVAALTSLKFIRFLMRKDGISHGPIPRN
ncbi:hypothetical protein [Paenibacillus cremeus]|uniref:Uncharacterized protein n=1 Tax=Paenibacillus cremeus TaxID=2163881 RepID=A0A559K4R1_9BACL|nr:hypothetical protein [Paenibacillus cremeus]TVY07122.1 hypothetical protein FPZ49_25360 [Paenibacillus cremeus]